MDQASDREEISYKILISASFRASPKGDTLVKELTEILGIKISNIYSWNYGTFADREIWDVEFDEDTFNRNSMNTGVMLLNFLKTLAIDFKFMKTKIKVYR